MLTVRNTETGITVRKLLIPLCVTVIEHNGVVDLMLSSNKVHASCSLMLR